MTKLEWVVAVPGHLSDQAVMFGNHPNKGRHVRCEGPSEGWQISSRLVCI